MEIDLNGKKETLVFNVKAAQAVSASCAGFQNVIRQLAAFDYAVFVAVLKAGMERPYPNNADLEKAVHEQGLVNLVNPLCDYVGRLCNGGRPLGETHKTEA